MGAKIQAFDIFQTPLSSHYPLPLRKVVYSMCVTSAQKVVASLAFMYNSCENKLYVWSTLPQEISQISEFIREGVDEISQVAS
jgi:hypothetical protein